MSNQQQTNMKEDQYKHKQQFSNVLNDIVFMTDYILTMTDETEKKSLSYCIIDHINNHDEAVYKKDQVWYCIKVPDYDKHKLDKNCYICAVGHMKQKTPDSLYSQLTELTNGKYVCDGDECFNMMMELAADGDKEQYKKICDEEECDTILDIDTPIMCYMNEERGDKTLCQECYEDGDYKKDDENSDNEDEEEKELKIIGYRPQTREGECSGCKSICEECENLIITEEEEEEEDYKYVKQYLKCSDEDLTDLIQTQYLEL